MSAPVFEPDGGDIVLVLCDNPACTWGSAFQFNPDDETAAQFAADVATQGAQQHAEHRCEENQQ